MENIDAKEITELSQTNRLRRKSTRLLNNQKPMTKIENHLSYDRHDGDLLQLMFKGVNTPELNDNSDEEDIFNAEKEDHKQKVMGQKAHLQVITDQKSLQCNVCEKKFADLNGLKSHILEELRVTGAKVSIGSDGNESVMERTNCDTKIKNLYKDLLVCEICNRRFMFTQQLVAHKRDHDVGKLLTCSVCYRNFTSKQQLEEHREVHVIKISCERCEKTFKTEKEKREHIRIEHLHNARCRYECKICGIVVTDIVAHMNVHLRGGSFCQLCRRHFTNGIEYNRHLRKCQIFSNPKAMELVSFDASCGPNKPGLCVHKCDDVVKVNVLLNSKSSETTDFKCNENPSKRIKIE